MEAVAAQIMTVECEFCHQHNDLVVNHVPDSQEVHCSRCGGVLGTVEDLRIDAQQETPAVRNG